MKQFSTFEKIAILIISLGVIFLIASSYGVQLIPGTNYLVVAAKAAGGWWKILGTAFLGAIAFYVYKIARDDWEAGTKAAIVIAVLLALAVSANIGFSYPYNF